jgi:hypothetical protein
LPHPLLLNRDMNNWQNSHWHHQAHWHLYGLSLIPLPKAPTDPLDAPDNLYREPWFDDFIKLEYKYTGRVNNDCINLPIQRQQDIYRGQ